MKDFVTVNINTDHNYECGTEILARAGEGSTTTLDITIPEALLNYDAYLDFEKPNGESIRTPRLEVVDGVAHYDIAPYILTEHGNLKVQVVLQGSNGEIWKSSIKQYAIQKSINAVDDIPDKEDFISEAQKLVDELNKDVSEIAEMLSNDPDFVDTVIDGMKFATWVNTIDGSKLRFFVGTKAQYEALTDTGNLFAIITDDTTKDELFDAIETNANAIKTNANAIKANADDIEENATQIATNKRNIANNSKAIEIHALHNFELSGSYTITNGAGTLSTGEINELEENGIYCVILVRAVGEQTYAYSAIMCYGADSHFINFCDKYTIIFTGDFIECGDLTLNGTLLCYKIGGLG